MILCIKIISRGQTSVYDEICQLLVRAHTYIHTRGACILLVNHRSTGSRSQEQLIVLLDPEDEGTTVLQNFGTTHPHPLTPSQVLGDGDPTAKVIKSTEAQIYHIPHQPWTLHS